MNGKSTVTDNYRFGQQAWERGDSFLKNPFHSWYDKEYFEWAAGWWERQSYYEGLSRIELLKEDEEINKKFSEEQDIKNKEQERLKAEERYKASKKGKAEAAGQKSLF